ncbi:MAG TPA: asparagine synthetase B family protein [Pyrinomonadaceae bacterium]|nr:asparagine synthetase B family protein [Pyrinomonadaceae bacterium]
MNELGGIVNFDDAAVDPDELSSLERSLSAYGCDESFSLLTASAGICFCAYHTTTKSQLTKQPLSFENGSIVVFDGVVQNRNELLRSFKLSVETSDVEIVAAGLARYGNPFIKQLIGSFALAWWNQIDRRLVLARDHIGSKPLYYRIRKQSIYFASEVSVLLASGTCTDLDEEYIAGFLGAGPKTDLTAYQSVKAVKPAHVLEINRKGIESHQFWSLSNVIHLNYSTDEAYEEHFNSVAREAVSNVIERANGPVFSELSGGLDSTAIVCLADEVTTKLGRPAIETLSRVHDDSPSSDEREFIQLVEKQRRKPSLYIREEDFPLLSGANSKFSVNGPNPFYCFSEYHQAVCQILRRKGVRTLLSGKGGDQILGGNPSGVPELADLFVQRRFFAFARSLRTWSLANRGPSFPLVGQSIRAALQARAPRFIRSANWSPPNWIASSFRKRMYLGPFTESDHSCGLPSDLDQSAGFSSVVATVSAQYRRHWGKIDVMHPWLYRPLVEFMQAIPFNQRVRPGENRSLMRRSLQEVLPARIVHRRGKRSPGEALVRAIRREFSRLQSLFDQPLIAAYGYADADELQSTLVRAREGSDLTSLSIVLAVSLEVWLRTINDIKNGFPEGT